MIRFSRPAASFTEGKFLLESLISGEWSGDGKFTRSCHRWLEQRLGAQKALLTHSCTAALEMAAILLDLKPGDEIIMPSFTFVSTANAFVLRGAVPVFVDIRKDTLNMDETKIETAITPRTRAIVVVHYAGVACDMDEVMRVAAKHKLFVVEDAAQAIFSTYRGKSLGTFGDLGCLSFHATKNIVSGEGGALLVNNTEFIERAEIIREKGTNRSRFLRGQVDKYTWEDIGSSFLPSDLLAAVLMGQLRRSKGIQLQRKKVWEFYDANLERGVSKGWFELPRAPEYEHEQNQHMFFILLKSEDDRTRLIEYLRGKGVFAVFHYTPLHSSPGGVRFGRTSGSLVVTDDISSRLLRLPLYPGVGRKAKRVIKEIENFFTGDGGAKSS
jgi:dTDP-4-amino-4,6-dideoxygalactose transaminase